jgi:hypothetical protein
MAKKERKHYYIDGGVISEFEKVVKRKGYENNSAAVEDLMKWFVAHDGQILMDDLYAPRISALVKRTMEKEIDRLAGMLYNVNVDVTANLYGQTAMHKKMLQDVEKIINRYINAQLLNPNPNPVSETFTVKDDGERIVTSMRKFARKDIAEKKREISKHAPEAKAASN